jgi:DNA invertase Pin-like site-specific DNA recombinase
MLTMIGAINEFERANTLDRQREGIRIAKEKGKYRQVSFSKDDFLAIYEKVKSGVLNVTQAAKELGTTRATYYAKIKEYNL